MRIVTLLSRSALSAAFVVAALGLFVDRLVGSTIALHSVTIPDGDSPSGVITDGSLIFGANSDGGSGGVGTLYEIKSDATGYKLLFVTLGVCYVGVKIYEDGASVLAHWFRPVLLQFTRSSPMEGRPRLLSSPARSELMT